MSISRVLPRISDADMVALCRLDQEKSANQKVEPIDKKTYERLVDLGYAVKDDRTGFRSITTLGISYIEGELHEEADSEDAAWKSFISTAATMIALLISVYSLFSAMFSHSDPKALTLVAFIFLGAFLAVLITIICAMVYCHCKAKRIRKKGRSRYDRVFIKTHSKC